MAALDRRAQLRPVRDELEVFVSDSQGIALIVDGNLDEQCREDSEWENVDVSAFCAGLAASTSLLSVSACALLVQTIWCADAFVF